MKAKEIKQKADELVRYYKSIDEAIKWQNEVVWIYQTPPFKYSKYNAEFIKTQTKEEKAILTELKSRL